MLHIEKVAQEVAGDLSARNIQFRVESGTERKDSLVIMAPEFERAYVLVEPANEMLRGVVSMNARKWVRRLGEEAAKRAAMNGAATAIEVPKPDDGEPRITDLALAEYLGWRIPRNIRAALIAPHLEDLKAVGDLWSEPIHPGRKGRRPGTKYFLTREQALVICAVCRGEKAKRGRERVIEAFKIREYFSRQDEERRILKPESAHETANGAGPAAAFVEYNGELRISDLKVAECLEAVKPKNIRGNLIKPHREKLERHGPLVTEPIERGPMGGRRGTTYFLNREQALILCELSRGGRSCRARDRVIELFARAGREHRALEAEPAPAKAPDPIERFDAIEKRLRVIERTIHEGDAAGRAVLDGFTAQLAGLTDELAQVDAALKRIEEIMLVWSAATERERGILANMRTKLMWTISRVRRYIEE